METDRIKPNIILGEVEINGAHGASWFLAEDSYILVMDGGGLRGEFTINTKVTVFNRTEIVTIKPAKDQAVVPPVIAKIYICEIQEIVKSDNGYTYKIQTS